MKPSGAFRHVFQVEQRATTQDAAGYPVGTWSAFLDCRGEVEQRTGSDKRFEGVSLAEISHTVTMWYQPGVLTGMRVNWGGRYLNIKSVIEDQRRRQLTLACLEQKE